jgi:hypothetical protein
LKQAAEVAPGRCPEACRKPNLEWPTLVEIVSGPVDVLLKSIALVVGSGGLVYWVSLYRNRARVRITGPTLVKLDAVGGLVRVVLVAELTNLAERAIAVDPEVRLSFRSLKDEPLKGTLVIDEADRALAPHAPRQFHLRSDIDARFPFGGFFVYRFKFTRGRSPVARVETVKGDRLGWWSFHWRRACLGVLRPARRS